ncbi:hypothetical protein SAMN05216548_1234 [Faunimonas pinastri]|uniref:Cytokinin riboside 5'-monophosphate phosphoribohydrolase n=1 Tax=Faunimonas pinastri TaxID=1855383 RepID=A0A1H9PVH6_9HYPH|nr:TIGR00730 family Rossman fold protein [Faunimonas pinastri]SER52118.1 hypothetical protein SAMN05216548_1234 [Faunimonas pinastri]
MSVEISNICVFCGSSPGFRQEYIDSARALATAMAARGIGLVYGGGHVGLMGAVADASLSAGASVVGIIPEALMNRELGHKGLTELHVVGSMHERKAMMADRSDAFVTLPGGPGTMEEMFEAWTWAQLGYHHKPVGFLNTAGFYDRLFEFIDFQVAEGFMKQPHRDMLIVENDPDTLLDRLAGYEPPRVHKWIEREQT